VKIPLEINLGANKWFAIGVGFILISGFVYYYYTVEKAAKLSALPAAGGNVGKAIYNFGAGLIGADVQPAGG
jgi:hypothetical protein